MQFAEIREPKTALCPPSIPSRGRGGSRKSVSLRHCLGTPSAQMQNAWHCQALCRLLIKQILSLTLSVLLH